MENYKRFTNQDCEFYPCHQTDRINCLFCFCPLYFLDCGGCYTLTSRGLKDCSNCLIPHRDNGYDTIVARLKAVAAARQADPDGPKHDQTEEPIEDT